jgi:hypothetical protein
MMRRGPVTKRSGTIKKRYKKKITKRVKNRTEILIRWTGGLLRKTTRASHTKSMLYKSSSDRILLKTKLVSDLDPDESRQIDALIKEAFGDSSIAHIDGMNYCIFSKIGKKIISAMFLKKTCQVPGSLSLSSPNISDCMYIHTVCVSNEYRGRGLLHKMLFYISKIERFKKTLFKLEAANTQDHGLNQDARFQIYSKSGFTLPIGTFVEPHRFTIKNVETSNKNEKKITYTVERDDGGVHTLQYKDIHPEACYFDNLKQNRGCIMETTSSKLRDFNT